jgi:hypothetical protein
MRYLIVVIFLLFQFGRSEGAEKKSSPRGTAQIQGTPRATLININNISMWATDNGGLERREDLSAGVTFPRGTTTAVYAGGLLWGGMVRDGGFPALRVGGQSYNYGTVPGAIVRPGVAENPDNADVRIYRIRRDWATADLTNDASDYFGVLPTQVTQQQIDQLREQYKQDWLEWPWQKGAPYYNRDGISGYQPDPAGAYDPTKDEPGLAGADQVLWFVANDLDPTKTSRLYGTPPIGLEMQVTCWAFGHTPELANVIFQRYRLIYKGTATTPANAFIDSMYLAKWSDIDIGDFSDDYAGCAVDRSVGFVYNAQPVDSKYTDFNLVPPVVGYDFLQGPRVQKLGATAHWNITTIQGYQNLPLTTFSYFTGDTRLSDFDFNVTGAREWWNVFRGYRAVPLNSPQCFIDPVTQQCTKFELSGDPTNLRGWVDGRIDPAGDRRIVLSSGPFTLARGDSQEVILALIAAIGKDNRNGIVALDSADDAAQDAFNFNFDTLQTVPIPPLRIVELNNKLILDWESDTTRLKKVESFQSKGYKFETYKIYQFLQPSLDVSKAKEFPVFDVSNPRFLPVTTDLIRNQPLVNGQKYYYAVTAIMFNPDPAVARQRIESPIVVLTGIPHDPNPGTVYPYLQDTASVSSNIVNIKGHNEAKVSVTYFDPTLPDGHLYTVLFHVNPNQAIAADEKPTWDLIDSTTNDTLLKRIRVDAPAQRVNTRGLSAQVFSVRNDFRGVYEVASHGQTTHSYVFNRPNSGGNYMIVAEGTSDLDTLAGGNGLDSDLELRFTGDSSWTVFSGAFPSDSRWVRVPYTAWQLRVQGNDTTYHQVYTTIVVHGPDLAWRATDLLNQSYDGKPFKEFYPITVIVDSFSNRGIYYGGTYYDDIPFRPDSAIVKAGLWANSLRGQVAIGLWKAYIADLDNDGAPAPIGTVVRFERYKRIYNGDLKLFHPAAVVKNDIVAARREVDRINVFPNPYYGMNRYETSRLQRFVTFNHLPRTATIRIFNLAGILVKTIRKDDDTQFATWDLNNENGLPVGGGMYLAHLELSDGVGNSFADKTLKLMIVRGGQIVENN